MGQCSYCGGFDGVKFGVKTPEEYEKYVDSVWGRMSSGLKESFERVFIGGGNALQVGNGHLEDAVKYTVKRFVQETGNFPRRLSMYGRTKAIIEKGRTGLSDLHHIYRGSGGFFYGLDLIYWGVETGSTDLLKWVNKGCDQKDLMMAADELRSGVVDTSVMVMPGLGGIRFYDEHTRETVKVLRAIQPNFLTFMGVNPAPGSLYDRKMQEEMQAGTNRPLTDYELAAQMIEIIRKMEISRKVKIGCFNRSVDAVGYNPFTFGAKNLYDSYDARSYAEFFKHQLEDYDEYAGLRAEHKRLEKESKLRLK